jgi:hypothetical protein
MNTPNNTYWNTRDDRCILIADMEEGYVENCIKMLTKKLKSDKVLLTTNKQLLCDLIVEGNMKAVEAALTDPNY